MVSQHRRVLRPAPGVLAFYDGRVEGYRWAEEENWVDEGALALGIASYAIVDGAEALVYDTHVSVDTPARSARRSTPRASSGSPSCSATGTSTTSPAPRRSPTAR